MLIHYIHAYMCAYGCVGCWLLVVRCVLVDVRLLWLVLVLV